MGGKGRGKGERGGEIQKRGQERGAGGGQRAAMPGPELPGPARRGAARPGPVRLGPLPAPLPVPVPTPGGGEQRRLKTWLRARRGQPPTDSNGGGTRSPRCFPGCPGSPRAAPSGGRGRERGRGAAARRERGLSAPRPLDPLPRSPSLALFLLI